MLIFKLQSYLEAIASDASLYEKGNFEKRSEAIDFIGFGVIDQIDEYLLETTSPTLLQLRQHAEKVRSALEETDQQLFQHIQSNIRQGGYSGTAFKALITKYVDFNVHDPISQEEVGYDNLDVLINGLSLFQTMPEQTKDLEPEMVYYQKTPARIVFELVEKSFIRQEDVFFDIGAGLGQVAILVNLLTGIPTKGIEFEPAFCDYARDCAASLNLSDVNFSNVDAREADYSEGTIFFMFTPFHGEILQAVLEILRQESLQRKIKIITYGPCTAQVALQNWLQAAAPAENNAYKLGIFSSF
ncbi:class I SAM-dependent methyltransferase [Chitinophaga sp.]|uniref:class I SAM-dependent methyltransferase n=1 Tax=Chitinophaga sp. TaxID=1869181 RepID=UPI002F9404B6